MPQWVVPLIVGLASAGTTAYSAYTAHSDAQDQLAAQQEAMKSQQSAQAQQTEQDKVHAIQAARQYVPNVQAQLGGAVSPEYYAQTAATQTGWGDQLGAVRQALAMQGLAPSATTQGLSANGTNPIPAAFNNTGDMSSILASLTGQGGQQFHGA